MPYDGSGNFTRSYNWVNDKNNAIKITASRMDDEFDNYATALNQVMLRNGVVPFGGNINMGNNTIHSLGNGSVGTPAIRFQSDTTTGLYSPTAGQVALSAGGTQRVLANSAGATITGDAFVSQGIYPGSLTDWYLNVAGGNPRISFDSNDFLTYDRAANSLNHQVGGATKFVVGANGEVYPGYMTNWYLATTAGNPVINFDSGDYYSYDRAGNYHLFNVASTERLRVSANGATVTGNVSATTAIFPGADVNYYLNMNGSNPQLVYDTGDIQLYERASNEHRFYVGGSNLVAIDANGKINFPQLSSTFVGPSSGNMLIAGDSGDYYEYTRASNEHRFYVGGTQQANFDASGRLNFATLSNAYSGASGGNARFQGDTNDYYQYDRTNNYHQFVTGGTEYWRINASGNLEYVPMANAFFGAIPSAANRIGMVGDTNDYFFFDRTSNFFRMVVNGSNMFYVDETYGACHGVGGYSTQMAYQDSGPRNFTGNYTLVIQDRSLTLTYGGTGGHTLSLQTFAFQPGSKCHVVNYGSGPLTIAPSGVGGTLQHALGTGARTLAVGGMGYIWARTGQDYHIFGDGIT
jgi:hypothetical protein